MKNRMFKAESGVVPNFKLVLVNDAANNTDNFCFVGDPNILPKSFVYRLIWENSYTGGGFNSLSYSLATVARSFGHPLQIIFRCREKGHIDFVEGWGSSKVSEGDDGLNVAVVREGIQGLVENDWSIQTYPGTITYYQSIVGRLRSLFRGNEQSERDKNSGDFQSVFQVFESSIECFFGFLFFGWGWCWWKGLYYHPDGRLGYALATCSCIGGVILWMYGFSGILNRSTF